MDQKLTLEEMIGLVRSVQKQLRRIERELRLTDGILVGDGVLAEVHLMSSAMGDLASALVVIYFDSADDDQTDETPTI